MTRTDPMASSHPLTPPPEMVQQWASDAYLSDAHQNEEDWAYEQHIAIRAAQWAADQELEECAEWVGRMFHGHKTWSDELRAARRPKPPSLKEQALAELAEWENVMDIASDSPIRRALEALPE